MSTMLALALWGGLLTTLLLTGKLATTGPTAPAAEPGPAVAAPRPTPASPVESEPPAAPETEVPEPLARYAVCLSAHGPARLSALAGEGVGQLAVHCGQSLHVLAVVAEGERLAPRRVLRLNVGVDQPGLGATPGAVDRGDLDGDGQADLLVSTVLEDDRGAARGGKLAWVPGAVEGGWTRPRSLGEPAASQAMFAELDGQPGLEVVASHSMEPSLAKPDELWVFSGGPTPARTAIWPAPAALVSMAALNLDSDPAQELAVLTREGLLVVDWQAGALSGAQIESAPEPLVGLREALVGDVDTDGREDLLLLGESLWHLSGASAASTPPRKLFATTGLRDGHLRDSDGDGKLDLVVYSHPELLAFVGDGQARFKRRVLARRGPGNLASLASLVADLNGDRKLDLVLLGTTETSRDHMELVFVSDVAAQPTLTTTDQAVTLPDAPLHQVFSLR